MSRLRDVTIGPIKTSGTSRLRSLVAPSVAPPEPVSQAPTPETLTDIQRIQQVPGIQPFLTLDLAPDLIYLLQSEGVEGAIQEAYPIPQPAPGQNDIAEPAAADPQVVVNQQRRSSVRTAFRAGGISNAVLEMVFPGRDPTDEEVAAAASLRANLTEAIYAHGTQRLAALVAEADPRNPSSIIFRHSSQDVHRTTQLVQIELIKNEPDVQERTTIQCACGSGKVRTTTVQTRRADEPPTVFAQCVTCKAKWKMSAA